MALIDDIQSAQALLLKPFINKQLLIRTPLSVVETLNPKKLSLWMLDPGDYGDGEGYVYLRLFPKYESEDEALGEKGYIPTFSRTAARPSATRRGFRAIINQHQAWIFYVIQRLGMISDSSSFNQHTPVKVIDFCRPEMSDFLTSGEGEVGTIRYGRIDIEKPPAIIQGVGVDYCVAEWEFKFSEVGLRI